MIFWGIGTINDAKLEYPFRIDSTVIEACFIDDIQRQRIIVSAVRMNNYGSDSKRCKQMKSSSPL